jgi:replicative DNA helicase
MTVKQPHNEKAEYLLLGSLMLENEQVDYIQDKLKPEHFYIPVHGRIYAAIVDFVNKGNIASPVTLQNMFIDDGDLQKVGGAKYLVQMAVDADTFTPITKYAAVVISESVNRQLLGLCQAITVNIGNDGKSAIDRLIEVQDMALGFLPEELEAGRAIDAKDAALSFAQSVQAIMNGERLGLSTGFTSLDDKMGRLQNSDLIIIAGRPSMGKTALATNIAFNVAKSLQDGAVALYSLEMSSEQIMGRIIAGEKNIPHWAMRDGSINNHQHKQLVAGCNEIAKGRLIIDDTPAISISHLLASAKKLHKRHNLKLLVLDYLQLMRSSKEYKGNIVSEVTEITQGLKALAKELNIPVIALSQLSRAVEQRENKIPRLSDLRESGSIEQDADIVAFVYREEYYLERQKPADNKLAEWQAAMDAAKGRADIMVAKHRHGAVGTAELGFNGNMVKFYDAERIE